MSTAAIRILADRVIDQIAAGEVVERPASAVKELVENSIDAGATQIVVVLRDGGRSLIRIEDNGRGMGEQDAMLSIERHATSKIRDTSDLLSVRSLGFRGEALPSIAAVSEFELITRRPTDDEGTRLRVDGGRLRDVRPTGAAVGTVVSARKLFYNVPVRQKFLRTVPTELGHCVHAVVRQAMVRPTIGFTIQHAGRTILDAPPTEDWANRVEDLVGPDGRGLLEIEADNGTFVLRGYVAPPERHRAHAADSTYLYVNGRWVRDHVLRRAVREAYRDRLPAGRHPLAVLELNLDPSLADINVHPTKAEVRFVDPASVVRFVAHTIASTLEGAGAKPRVGAHATSYIPSAAPLFAGRPTAPEPTPAPVPLPVAVVAEAPVAPWRPEAAPASIPAVLADEAPPDLDWVALVGARWGLASDGDRLLVIDLGRVARQLAVMDAQAPGRPLLVPSVIRMSEAELAVAEAQFDRWAELGLVADRFSPVELAVRSVPDALGDVDPEALVRLALATNPDADVRATWAKECAVLPVTDGPELVAEARRRGVALEGRLVELTNLPGRPWQW